MATIILLLLIAILIGDLLFNQAKASRALWSAIVVLFDKIRGK